MLGRYPLPLSSGGSAILVKRLLNNQLASNLRPVTLRYMPFDTLAFVRTPDCDVSHISFIAAVVVFLSFLFSQSAKFGNDSCIIKGKGKVKKGK